MAEDVRKTKISPDLSQEDYVAFCGLARPKNGTNTVDMPEIVAKVRKRSGLSVISTLACALKLGGHNL